MWNENKALRITFEPTSEEVTEDGKVYTVNTVPIMTLRW
jgi:hypothetical protein